MSTADMAWSAHVSMRQDRVSLSTMRSLIAADLLVAGSASYPTASRTLPPASTGFASMSTTASTHGAVPRLTQL